MKDEVGASATNQKRIPKAASRSAGRGARARSARSQSQPAIARSAATPAAAARTAPSRPLLGVKERSKVSASGQASSRR